MKKSCSLKLDRFLDRNSIYWYLRTKLDRSSIEVESIEIYEIKISRSDFWPMLTCMCRVSFLIALDIYKTYFKGHYTWRTHALSDLVPYSLWKKLLCFYAQGAFWSSLLMKWRTLQPTTSSSSCWELVTY